MADPVAGLRHELDSMTVARRDFPIWTDWGVADESHAVHSLGLSYLVRIGQELGYVCASEFPVAGHHVRADAVWWDRETRRPVAVFEFERLKDGSELVAKVRNLMRAWHATGRHPVVLGLVFWQKNFYAGDASRVADLWRELERGYRDSSGAIVDPVPASVLSVYECLHTQAGSGHHVLKRFKQWSRA
jgi:hypothetical protein